MCVVYEPNNARRLYNNYTQCNAWDTFIKIECLSILISVLSHYVLCKRYLKINLTVFDGYQFIRAKTDALVMALGKF